MEKKISIAAGAIAIIIFIWQLISWANVIDNRSSNNETDIKTLDSRHNNLNQRVDQIYINKDAKSKPEIIENEDLIKYKSGELNVLNEKLYKKHQFHSLVAKNLKVCAVNINNSFWRDNFGQNPNLGNFISIYFPESNNESWALVIDRYEGKNTNAVINISPEVLEELQAFQTTGTFDAEIKLMAEEEWSKDLQKKRTFKELESLVYN